MKIRYVVYIALWFVTFGLIIEPFLIAPAFSSSGTIDLAFNGSLSHLVGGDSLFQSTPNAVNSMDHFRISCLVGLGLPLFATLIRFRNHM